MLIDAFLHFSTLMVSTFSFIFLATVSCAPSVCVQCCVFVVTYLPTYQWRACVLRLSPLCRKFLNHVTAFNRQRGAPAAVPVLQLTHRRTTRGEQAHVYINAGRRLFGVF